MKKSKLIILGTLLSFALTSRAQTFNLLATDRTGDNRVVNDITKLSYRANTSLDSIWFRIETTTAITDNDGFMIGIDGNQDTSDGIRWRARGDSSKAKYDMALFTAVDYYMGDTIRGIFMGIANDVDKITGGISQPDSNVLIFSARLSQIDDNGKFNLVLGAGASDIMYTGFTEDNVPDTGYLTINESTTSLMAPGNVSGYTLYPNPAKNEINLSNGNANMLPTGDATVYNISGKKITCIELKNGKADISFLPKGSYILVTTETQTRFIKE